MLFSQLSDALISPCGMYRYLLTRTWGKAPPILFVMLNPSTADAAIDDQTIRRCVSYGKALGAGGIIVVNLYALRATDPAELLRHPDPVGPENDRHLREAIVRASRIIVAFGSHPMVRPRLPGLVALAGARPLECLGTTKDGWPRHPSRLPNGIIPSPWFAPV